MNQYLVAIEIMRDMLRSGDSADFSRNKYAASFESRYIRYVPAFDAIEALYQSVGEPEEMIANMAEALVDTSVEMMEGAGRREREKLLMEMNLNLATYILPSILRYQGKSSQPLCDAVLKAWKKQYPKTNVQAASFETIEQGFHKKFCYITTAVCRSQDKPDDCAELQTLRAFRDGYMMQLADGEELIKRYYDVAPTIVKHINKRSDADQIYQDIWETYLRPCLSMIDRGENDACKDLYIHMVDTLQDTYFITM